MPLAPQKNNFASILSFHQMAISLISSTGDTTTFDPAGRPIRISMGGQNYIRGLDGTMKEKGWNSKWGMFGRIIKTLDRKQSQKILRKVFTNLKETSLDLARKNSLTFQISIKAKKGGFDSPQKILHLLLQWSVSKLKKDEKHFRHIYKPLNILPPDQYFSVIIQVAEGCPWNKCTFCHFYKGRKFRIKNLSEIKSHIREVKNFLGEGVHLRKSVFLSDANALSLPTCALGDILKEIQSQLPDQCGPDGGIFAFGDVPSILAKSQKDLTFLKMKGLRRIYIGLESGSDRLRQILKKPSFQKDAIAAVQRLKKSGLKTGIIVLLSDFGTKENEDHIRETAKTINAMKLSNGDFLYFSPLHKKGVETPESQAKRIQQFQEIKKRLYYQNGKPVSAIYDVREFVV